MAVAVVLTLALVALATYIVLKYIGSSYKRAQVFKTMGVRYIPPLASRWTAQKNIFFATDHLGVLDAKQVEKYGKVFGKLEINSEPLVVVAEPDLLRDIFVKQFNIFCNRRALPTGATKLFRESIFFQRDQRWRDIRSLISPTFSTAKLHAMDGLIRDCLVIMDKELNGRFEQEKGVVEIDAKNYFSNFAMDVVGTVFFGVGVDAITNRQHPFVKHAFEIVRPGNLLRVLLFVMTPGNFLRRQIVKRGLIGLRKPTRDYFENVIPGLVNERRRLMSTLQPNQLRKDFVNVLITAREKATTNEAMTATGNLLDNEKDDANMNAGATAEKEARSTTIKPPRSLLTAAQNGAVHSATANGSVGNGSATVANGKANAALSSDSIQAAKTATMALTDDEIAGQIFIFLVAGFETTASTVGFLFHELALNQKVQVSTEFFLTRLENEILVKVQAWCAKQDRLRIEICNALGDTTQLSYDSVAEMALLDACINETLRLYPPVSRLERECMQDTVLSNGMEVKKGIIIGIPAWYIQRSPENFEDPDKFDADRFYDAERRAQMKPYTFMPFGQGPRNCVGMRFALLELKMITAFVVRNYRIVPTAKTIHPIPLEARSASLTRPKYGAFVGIERLSK